MTLIVQRPTKEEKQLEREAKKQLEQLLEQLEQQRRAIPTTLVVCRPAGEVAQELKKELKRQERLRERLQARGQEREQTIAQGIAQAKADELKRRSDAKQAFAARQAQMDLEIGEPVVDATKAERARILLSQVAPWKSERLQELEVEMGDVFDEGLDADEDSLEQVIKFY